MNLDLHRYNKNHLNSKDEKNTDVLNRSRVDSMCRLDSFSHDNEVTAVDHRTALHTWNVFQVHCCHGEAFPSSMVKHNKWFHNEISVFLFTATLIHFS